MPERTPQRAALDRALALTKKSESGRWLFTGSLDKDGYGLMGVTGVGTQRVHRLAYEVLAGPIPEGMEIDHLCRVRNCMNPVHLEAVTRRVNSLRSESFAAINARKTHCIHGHEFTPENTYYRTPTHRQCRQCGREASTRYFATKGRARDRRRRAT